MPSYTQRTFPLASHFFSVYRRNQNTVDITGNIIPVAATSTVPIATNVSILLRDLEDSVIDDKQGAGYIATSRFLGLSFPDSLIIIGDIIEDEDPIEVDRFGKQIRYFCDGLSRTPMATKLHLEKMELGI